MMTGTSIPFRRSSRQTSQPESAGIATSSRTRSGASRSASASPSRPLVADTVSYPSKRRLSSSPRTISGSSSTIRILGIAAERQPEREPAALPGAALHGHTAAVGLGDVLDEGQADPAAAAALRLAPPHPVELLEDPCLLLHGN